MNATLARPAMQDSYIAQEPGAVEVWRRYHAGERDETIEGSVVETYLHLVKTVVGKLAMNLPRHVDYDDLYSAGLIGLLHAVRRYDPSSKTPFECYARYRIRGAVLDEVRSSHPVSRSVQSKAKRVMVAIDELAQRLGRVPTEEESAAALGLDIVEYQRLLDDVRPMVFIPITLPDVNADADFDFSGLRELVDDSLPAPDVSADMSDTAAALYEHMQKLPLKQRKVLALYYIEDLRLSEIAQAFCVSESRISQLHTQAILALRSAMRGQLLATGG